MLIITTCTREVRVSLDAVLLPGATRRPVSYPPSQSSSRNMPTCDTCAQPAVLPPPCPALAFSEPSDPQLLRPPGSCVVLHLRDDLGCFTVCASTHSAGLTCWWVLDSCMQVLRGDFLATGLHCTHPDIPRPWETVPQLSSAVAGRAQKRLQ